MFEGSTVTASAAAAATIATTIVTTTAVTGDSSALARSVSPLGRAALGAERLLPVAAPLQTLLPGGGLRRGRAVAVRGAAAPSLAMALGAEASRAGSWMAVVGPLAGEPAGGRSAGGRSARGRGGTPGAVADLGVEAAAGLGVALERVVRVAIGSAADDAGGDRGAALRWADAMAAILDGFEIVVTAVPAAAVVVRKVQRRLARREAAVVVIGDPGALDVDVELRGRVGVWEGLDEGAGHLRRRRLDVSAAGRRMPRPARADLWLPAADGRLDAGGVPAILDVPTFDVPARGPDVSALDAGGVPAAPDVSALDAAALDAPARSGLLHGSSAGVLERLWLDPLLDPEPGGTDPDGADDVDETGGERRRSLSRVG